ncbi:MAG TPA: non-ribosomal peptide synthase/polyketide synthase, partial [Thermoanaerobaculia bacterium]|nr:non-ribosomal peptide synthase/polyketide synthase [Thermoanaerobaculia bacterium]
MPSDPDPISEAALTREGLATLPAGERRSALARALRRRASAALGVAESALGLGQPLLELGLDSLAAIELAHGVETDFGIELPLEAVFDGASCAELAERLIEATAILPASGLRRGGPQDAVRHPVWTAPTKTRRRKVWPGLSSGERGLWFLDRLLPPDDASYRLAAAARLTEPVAAPELRDAFQRLVDRHEALRTTYVADEVTGEPVRRVAETAEVAFVERDAMGWSAERLAREVQEEAWRPFDLEHGPLFRVALLTGSPEGPTLVIALHHIIADFTSLGLLARQLGAVAGLPSPGERAGGAERGAGGEGPSAFARRQTAELAGPRGDALWSYWRHRLADLPAAASLPYDRAPRPGERLSGPGGSVRIELGAERTERLQTLARRQGVTLYAAVLAMYAALLARLTGETDLTVGSPAAGRPDAAKMVGYFVNPLVLRFRTEGDPAFTDILARAGQELAGALAHQEMPFPLLVERLRQEPFRTMLVLYRAPAGQEGLVSLALGEEGEALQLGPIELTPRPFAPRSAQLDLTLSFGLRGGSLGGQLIYHAGRFDAVTMRRLAGQLETLLDGALSDPERRLSDLPLLSDAARHQLVLEANDRPEDEPAWGSLQEGFERQARRTPDRTAVVDGRERTTYEELNRRANQLARHLVKMGVGAEDRVAVVLGRTTEAVAALLGVLKAGAAYVPLDPSHPRERLEFLLADSRASAVVTRQVLEESVAESGEDLSGWPGRAFRSLAYVIHTSGSTGRPKGVGIEHGSALRLIEWAGRTYSAQELAGVLASTSFGFDLSIFEIFAPLSFGGTVILAENALALPELPAASEVTLLNTVPSAISALIDLDGLPPRLRTVNLAGEPLRQSLAERVLAAGVSRLFNLYGPSEDTTYSTGWRVEPGEEPPIGRPLAGSRAYVTDVALRLLPFGVAGELCLGGFGLARGYLGRPDLTAERFVPDPWSGERGEPGGRLYRTGDRVLQRPDGALLYRGRLDRQLKIRGFRIEPGEVEAALLALPWVREAAVVRPTGQDVLAAFVVLGDEAPATAETDLPDLRAALGRRLPAPLVPSITRLDRLPLTPNGKVDRKALAERAVAAEPVALQPPLGETETRLAEIWRGILGPDAAARIGHTSRFFDLGGHSLLAARLVARVRAVFGVELPLSAAFDAPRLMDQARRIEAGLTSASATIPRADAGSARSLSFAQERLWFLDQLAPGQAVYNMPVALRLSGPLNVADIAALTGALTILTHRHAALRTTFATADGAPYAVVQPAEGVFSLPLIDVSEAEALRLAQAEAVRPFDLAAGPLVRAVLLRLGAEEHLLVLVLHHIVADGWSLDVLARELSVGYAALIRREQPALPDLPIQYSDYAAWQRASLGTEALAAELGAWRDRLAGLPPVLTLPGDRPRPPVQSLRGGTESTGFPAPLRTALGRLGTRSGATPFMVWLAGFAALLARLTGETDLAIGTAVANRPRLETEGLIGLFVNSLAVRGDLSGNPSFLDLLGCMKESALWAFSHQELPFEKLVEALAPVRALSHAPLFQVMLVAEVAAPAIDLPGLTVRRQPLDTGTAKLDLLLTLRDEGVGGELEFNRDLFDRTTALRLLAQLGTLLTAVAAAPEQRLADLPLLAEAERQQLIEWNTVPSPGPGGATLSERFAAQARRTPEAEAIVEGLERISYSELAGKAREMSGRLARLGVGPEVRVGVFLPRTADMVAALLGVLAAGGAYVPLDPRQPATRLLWTLEDAGVSVLISEPEMLGRLAEGGTWKGKTVLVGGVSSAGLPSPGDWEGGAGRGAGGEGLAYVIYTSGSTGRPKGVAIEHRSAMAMLDWGAERFSPEELSGVLAATSIAFDLSVFEIFLPLTTGGRVILARDALELTSLPAASEVTLVNTVPSAMTEILRLGGLPASVRTVNLAGEPLPALLAADLYRQPQVRQVWNLYGPSEDTTYSTGSPVPRDGGAPAIGRPLPGTLVRVLDAALQPVPVGVPGELCLGGSGLARGYLGRPELTAARFIPDSFCSGGEPGSRLYRTGDLVRFRPDGELDFLGRADHQVKVRGFRIELGEIEAVLAEHPAVRAAAVLVDERPAGARLVACWAPRRPEADAEPAALRAFLRERLPEPMLPSSFVRLAVLPLTPNGKIDRKALQDQIAHAGGHLPGHAQGAGTDAPRGLLEERIAGIWREALGSATERIDPTASFFEIGGHSLLATRVISRLRGVFGVELPVRTLFEAPSVRELARCVEVALDAARGGAESHARPPISKRTETEPPPLSFAQERLWFLDRLEAGAVYNIPLAIAVHGALDPALLAHILATIARRHESLRTTFELGSTGSGTPVQVIAPPESAAIDLPSVDLTALPAPARPAEARRLAAAEAGRRFDLSRGPLVRAALLRLAAQEHVLLLNLHHIIADGWSMGVMVEEIAALYRVSDRSDLPELPIQYADFAVWQRHWLGETELAHQMRFWRERLETAPLSLALPADRPRPAAQSFRGAAIPFVLGPDLAAGLLALGQRCGATPFMTLLAGFAALLLRLTGQDDLVIGTPIANRNLLETETLIGFFVNSLPLRLDLAGDPALAALIAGVRETALAAYAHQDLPFERLVEELRPERHLAQNPLFQVMLAFQNAPLVPLAEMDLPGIALEPFPFAVPAAKLDLQLDLTAAETAEGTVLLGELRYATDLFDAVTMERLIGYLRTLLAAGVADPEIRLADLPLFGEGQRHQLAVEWNADATPSGGVSFLALFAEQVARAPEAAAVVCDGNALTYEQLDRRANALARRLRTAGVTPGAAVGLCAGRSAAAVAGLLGIWKAGAVYVPLAPEHPRSRLSDLLAEAGISAVVFAEAQEGLLAEVAPAGTVLVKIDAEEVAAPLEPPPPGPLAYLIYTSGTTGQPKAVMVEHSALAIRLAAMLGRFGFAPGERMPAIAPFTSDLSLFELLAPLASGGTVVLFPLAPTLDVQQLVRELPDLDRLHAVPAVMRQVAERVRREADPRISRRIKELFVGGDVVPADLLDDLRRAVPHAQVWELYGSTETVLSLLGRPLPGSALTLRDRTGRQVPIGVAGEIWTGGGLARGYRQRPDLTAQRFVPAPGGGRLFRTGDLARQLPDGRLEFLGRTGEQVNVRGFRIEPGEIERALLRHPEVLEAVVAAQPESGGPAAEPGARLVAYVVRRSEPDGGGALATAISDTAAAEHVAAWRALYDETYSRAEGSGAGESFTGWTSSYTGLPIPAPEMREWLDGTVERILALGRHRVLEIGCGAGVLAARLLPHVERYRGIDFSAPALDRARRLLRPPEGTDVELMQGLADDWSGVVPGAFDLVVINSVAQYFPSAEYLQRVLEAAVGAVAPGGAVFVGDVRSLPLLPAFHASVELATVPAGLAASELLRRAEQRGKEEEELVVDPAFFFALAARLPAVRHVEARVKRGRARNELTRFRFDVVLHVGEAAPAAPPWTVWTGDLSTLEKQLTGEAPEALAISGIPDARLVEITAWTAVGGEGPNGLEPSAADLRKAVAQQAARLEKDAVEPEDLVELGRRAGYAVEITWSTPEEWRSGRFSAVFSRSAPSIPAPVRPEDLPSTLTAFTNAPLAGKIDRRARAQTVGELRRFLRGELPPFMVPSAFVLLDALPLTAHGKVDRAALPLPAGIGSRTTAYVAPRTPVEEAVAEIWTELLDVSGGSGDAKVSIRDSFFALGGHSLLATQVVARLRERFGVELPVRAVFEEATLADLAARVEMARRSDGSGGLPPPPARADLEAGAPRPASFAQRRLWFLDRLEPGTALYNMPAALAAHGDLDVAAMTRALSEIARRHEALRTVFAEEAGEPVQQIQSARPLAVPMIDLSALAAGRRWQEARDLAVQEAGLPFDLARGPLWRVRLLRLAEREHQALLTLHHIVSDGWSTEVLVREVAALYTAFAAGRPGGQSPLPELPLQYGDYAIWQRRWLIGAPLERELAYWRRQLAGAPALELPADRPRPAFASHRGALVQWTVPEPLGAGLRMLGRRYGATLFSTLLAAFQALLFRLSGQDDVSVGTPVAGRSHVEIEGLIGFFVNTLVLRAELAGGRSEPGDPIDPIDPTFRELLVRARETALAAQAHQAVPFDRLVEELAPERDLARTPLFQVMLALQNAPRAALDLPGLTLAPLPLGRPAGDTAKLDLTLTIEEGAGGLSASFEYSTDLFDRATIVRWAGHLERLMAGAVESPSLLLSELPLLSPAERHELAVGWNDGGWEAGISTPSRSTLWELFVRQAERTPGAWALEGAADRYTFGELRGRAEQLAARLRRHGVVAETAETVVAVCVERSPALVVGLLGTLAAGGVYLPIDPALPELRRDLLLTDSGARVLVTETGLLSSWPVPATVEPLCVDRPDDDGSKDQTVIGPLPGQLAYLIYTSGSSGQPKGVAVTHEEAARHCAAAIREYGLTADDRVLQFLSAGFDFSLEEILPTLAAGATVVLRGPELPHPADLLAELARRAVTVANFPTAYWQQWTREEAGRAIRAITHPPLRLVVVGGEAMSPPVVPLWQAFRRAAFPAARLLNSYGPTEAIITATLHAVTPADEHGGSAVSIGRPMPHRSAYVADRHGGLQPVEVPGELWLGGLLARGYLGDPARTAERFIPDPFGPPGGRLYRTGDLVRREPAGEISFLGRLDHQVKVRGFRVELGEIETAVAAEPGVREAVVVVWGDGEERRLAAFFVAEPGREVPPAQIRSRLREKLPGALVPSAFVPLAVLPLTPNGKVDRKALPNPFAATGGRQDEDRRPRTPVEEVVAAIWCDVLELPAVRLDESFFDLGGHSLLATRVSSRLRAAFGVELPLRDLFERPTIEGIAGRVEAARRLAAGDRSVTAPPIIRAPHSAPAPLSFAQQRLWFLDRMEPGGSAYNIPFGVLLEGPLNIGLLLTVLGEIVRRHEALRTRFEARGGDPVQVIDPPRLPALPIVDLGVLPGAVAWTEALRLAETVGALPFDLARGPLLHAVLLRLSPARHALLAAMHHIVSDEWSMRVLLREVVVLYKAFGSGLPSPLSELPVQYTDYAVWQRRWLKDANGEPLGGQLAFWRQRLGDEPPVLELPADRPRPAVQSYRGGTVPLRLPDALARSLLALSRRASTTPFMTLLAAFAVLLRRSTGQTDLAIGTPVSGRTRLEVEEVIGFFLNTLVLRIDLAGDPGFSSLLAQVREQSLAAYAHQDLPFEKLVDELRPQRSLAHSPLFQALFVLLHETPLDEEVLGLHLTALTTEQKTAKFDLSLALAAEPEALSGAFEYAADLFDRTTIVRWIGHFERLLTALSEDPERPVSHLPLASSAETQQVLREWNDTASDLSAEVLVHELFARAVRRNPEAQAVVWPGGAWSYAEFDSRAERLARRLRQEGVGPDVPVGVLAHRGPHLAVAFLAVLKAGGAHLPLDPSYPAERLRFMLEDSGAPVVLTGPQLRIGIGKEIDLESFDWTGSTAALPTVRIDLDNISYVIYTSGSTGKPKGTALPHRTLANLIAWQIARLRQDGVDPCLRTLQFASPSFDVSVQELLATWCAGATLVIGPEEARRDPRLLVEVLERERIERLSLPYVALQQLAEYLTGDEPAPSRLRQVVTAGERLQITPQIAAMIRRLPGCALHNQYGPSETHVVTAFSLTGEPSRWPLLPPIGRPLTGVTAYVLDRDRQSVPLGVSGELALGGVSLARGYIGRPDLTAEKFVPDPFARVPGGRLYLSGDLARFRPDGEIDFLGRIDDQVKIRGFRIEPGEIEVALAAHEQVREAVVVARGDGTAAGRRLIAYVTPAGAQGDVKVADLRAFLRDRLPEHMVPAAFVVLAALPLTGSGKVQRSALPEPEGGAAPAYVPPATALERRVAEVVAAQLGAHQGARIGRDDNFFDAGAHSLLLVRVAAELTRQLGRTVAVVDLFRFSTVASLARHLGDGTADDAPPDRAVFEARAAERVRGRQARAPQVRRDEMVQEVAKSIEQIPEPEAFEQIAVIGMACRYPGAANPGELWRNLRDGVESITRFSDEELAAAGVPAATIADPAYVKAAGVIDGPEMFDADFFAFTPREAELMDPQQRIFLECAWQACEDAGYVPQSFPGRIGVYGGAAAGTYFIHNVLTNPDVVAAAGGMQVKLLNDKDFLTTHVSYKLNLRGPSLAIQTACSTSLVAVHVACQALLDGECEMALAGGTGISFPHRTGAFYQEGGINSPDGHCRAFDINAKGLVDGNGTGVVLLKRLSRALADGDVIHAVIRGSAINNDGALKAGYTVPSVDSQMEVIGEALAAARVDADSIGLVEAHGSGTPLGDPIEVRALSRAFRSTTDRKNFCALGSIKTNIGHTDAAAGVAGLIKAVLALENRQIPPSLHFETPNPEAGLPESPFFVPIRALDWPAGETPRRADVSSLGIGGTNAHVVLEEAPPTPAAAPSRPWQLLTVSARSRTALDQAAARLGDYLDQSSLSRFEVADVAHTLRVGRKAFPQRRALLCRDRAGAVAGFADPARWIEGTAPAAGERPVAFLFPGLGEHYTGMAAGLYRAEPVFRAAIDRSAEILGPHLGIDLRELLVYWEGGTPTYERAPGGGSGAGAKPDLRRLLSQEPEEEDDEAGRQLNRTAFAHPAVFAVEHALAELWLAWGIRPRAMIGYSLGEYVAACLAGVFSLDDALALVAGRARLIDALPAGAMLAVPLSVPETEALLAGESGLSLAAANGPGLSVIAGPEAAATAFARRLAERGIACRRLRTSHAFHSPMMRPAAAELTRLAASLTLKAPRIPFISNVTGTWITDREATDPAYWAEHLCLPVRFASGLATLASNADREDDAQLLLEVGPGQTLGTLARQRPNRPAGETVIASLRDRHEEVSDQAFLLDALARLWVAGAAPDWAAFTRGERRRRMPLPTYPFERRRYFLEPGTASAGLTAARTAGQRLALEDWFSAPYWESAPQNPHPRPLSRAVEGG